MANAATVDEHSAAYDEMSGKWAKIDDLLGGTAAMRAAGEAWLPKMELEGQGNYERRLAISFLFNAYADTVRKVAAKPFTKPLVVEGNEKLTEQLQLIRDNADRAGASVTQLARELFWIGINRGVFHVLVDYPQGQGDDGEGDGAAVETMEDEESAGKRPVLIPLWPDDIIAWQTREGPNGETILTQARIHEVITRYGDADGDRFDEGTVERIRVFTEKTWEIWEKAEDQSAYAMTASGSLSREGVPIVTGYFEKVDFMIADPPLEDLAWLNLEHWQSSSDQRNILRFARTGVWWLSGVSEDEANGLALGPSAKAWSKNENADMKVVEHSGASIKAGAADLTKLEEQMQIMGLRPFLQQARGATATSQTINEARGETEIQSWIRSDEETITNAYKMAAEWVGAVLPDDFKIDIATEFATSLRAQQDATTLIEARKLGDIDQETLLTEFKRRRILADDVVVSKVMDATGSEGPDLSQLTRSPTGGGAGEE